MSKGRGAVARPISDGLAVYSLRSRTPSRGEDEVAGPSHQFCFRVQSVKGV